jgi:hypothetical protein
LLSRAGWLTLNSPTTPATSMPMGTDPRQHVERFAESSLKRNAR